MAKTRVQRNQSSGKLQLGRTSLCYQLHPLDLGRQRNPWTRSSGVFFFGNYFQICHFVSNSWSILAAFQRFYARPSILKAENALGMRLNFYWLKTSFTCTVILFSKLKIKIFTSPIGQAKEKLSSGKYLLIGFRYLKICASLMGQLMVFHLGPMD